MRHHDRRDMTTDQEQTEDLVRVLDDTKKLLEQMHKDIYSYDKESPGVLLRMDRIEGMLRQYFNVLRWFASGGLTALGGALIMLWKIFQALDATKI